jgi:hypothetical protein
MPKYTSISPINPPTPTHPPPPQLSNMSAMFARIDLMEGAANRTYRLVLDRYPRNAKLLRSYGRFLENVKQDPWGAAKYYAEAEKQVGGRGGVGWQSGGEQVEAAKMV